MLAGVLRHRRQIEYVVRLSQPYISVTRPPSRHKDEVLLPAAPFPADECVRVVGLYIRIIIHIYLRLKVMVSSRKVVVVIRDDSDASKDYIDQIDSWSIETCRVLNFYALDYALLLKH